MSPVTKLITALKGGKYSQIFSEIYPIGWEQQPERYSRLAQGFQEEFGQPVERLQLFSSPGRTEIGGNHTDHQNGKVLAAAVHLDTGAVVAANSLNKVIVYSVGFGKEEVDLGDLGLREEERNTTLSLIRGIAARTVQLGYQIGGFTAYLDSQVPVGSGLSSSAAFENLVTTIFSHLYNEGEISPITVAQIGQFAENEFFGKPSGLLDQATSAVGGMITIDFKDTEQPIVRTVHFDPGEYGHSMVIVNTGGDHADLTDEYTSIFRELKEISAFFGKEVLRQVDFHEFLAAVPTLRQNFGERSVIRALHIYEDNQRVEQQIVALEQKEFPRFKELVNQSGQSSFMQLQNVFSCSNPTEQPLSLALSLSQLLLQPVGGAWRVQGGGFAGTIQAYLPIESLPAYLTEMDRVFGQGACQVLTIRPIGSALLAPNTP